MNTAVSRRNFLGLSLAVTGAAALTGCQGFGGGSSKPSSGTLSVAIWGDATRGDRYRKALALYKESHPEINADLQIADFAGHFERLTTQAAAKNLPDLFWMNDTNYGRYAKSGSLLNLQDMLGKQIDVSGIGDAGVASGRIADGVFGLPTHYNGQAILVNDAALKKAGINFSNVKTWDDLASAATDLTDPATGTYGLTDPTLGVTQRPLEVWIRQSGGELVTNDGKLGFDAALLTDWFTYWQRLREAKVIPAPALQLETDWERHGWDNDLLVKGQAGIRLASASHYKDVSKLTDIPIAMHEYIAKPDAPDDWRFLTVLLLCAGGNTASPEQTAELLDFLINNSEAAMITQTSMGVPSSPQLAENLLSELSDQEKTYVEYMVREMGYPRRPVPTKPEGLAQLNAAISKAGEEVAFGRTSAGNAAQNVVTEAGSILAR